MALTEESIEFTPGAPSILFFIRGRGRGHAIPSLEIVKKLEAREPRLQIRLVSYGTGAATLEALGRTVIDLGLPDFNSVPDTIILAAKLVGWLRPDLVVAHEEFAALAAARIFDRPSIFLTDWMPEPGSLAGSLLRHAGHILYLDEPPATDIAVPLTPVGHILRDFAYSRSDRQKAREELAIPADSGIILVLPGSVSDQDQPIAPLVAPAFDKLGQGWRMIWLAGEDAGELRERFQNQERVLILDFDWQPERLMAAADVAITKATRKTGLELQWFGIPFVAITHGVNRVDDETAARMRGARLVKAQESSPDTLAELLRELAQQPCVPADSPKNPLLDGRGAQRAAQHILSVLEES